MSFRAFVVLCQSCVDRVLFYLLFIHFSVPLFHANFIFFVCVCVCLRDDFAIFIFNVFQEAFLLWLCEMA